MKKWIIIVIIIAAAAESSWLITAAGRDEPFYALFTDIAPYEPGINRPGNY